MTEKLFHTNNETLLEGIYFDPSFSRLREPKNIFTIPKEIKEALERSIERGRVVKDGFQAINDKS